MLGVFSVYISNRYILTFECWGCDTVPLSKGNKFPGLKITGIFCSRKEETVGNFRERNVGADAMGIWCLFSFKI